VQCIPSYYPLKQDKDLTISKRFSNFAQLPKTNVLPEHSNKRLEGAASVMPVGVARRLRESSQGLVARWIVSSADI
jgi:hypothetical protein